jgi:hypothetical protein
MEVSLSKIRANVDGSSNAVKSVDPSELISAAEAARLLHQKPQTLAAWRSGKRGPEYLKVGRAIFYRRASIGAFLAASIVNPDNA